MAVGIQGIRWSARCRCLCCKMPSNWLEVEICQGGKVYKQRYERGHVCYALKEIGTCPMEKTGTKVTFLPDDTILLRQRYMILMY